MHFSNRNLFHLALPLLAAFAVTGANAAVVFSTGFESPAYSTVAIAGQNGWGVYGPGLSIVEGAFAKTGDQAVFVDGGTASQSGPYHTNVTTGPFVRLSADLAIFTSSTQSEFQFGGLGAGLIGFLGGFNVLPNDSVQAITAGYPIIGTFTRATAFDSTAWHHVELFFNIPAQVYDVTIDGVTLAAGLAFCGDNGPCNGATLASYNNGLFDSFGINGTANDSGYMDNFQVEAFETAPEPASILLIATGLGAVILRRRKSN